MRGGLILLISALALAKGGTVGQQVSGSSISEGNARGGGCGCNGDPGEASNICNAADSHGVLIAHENCNYFYQCAYGSPHAFRCYGTLLYNPVTEQCDWPENVDCGDRGIPDPEDEGSDNEESDGGNDNDGNEEDESDNDNDGEDDNNGEESGPGNCDPSEAPAICAAADSESVLVAHENCNQFYICAGGLPVAMNCGGNLLFNPATNNCDWPENVNCGDRVIPDGDDSNVDGSDGDDNNGGGCGCHDNPSEAPEICAAEGSNDVLVAHENCNQFYICSFGSPVAMSCPDNLLYNPATEQCDWPENVECGDRVIPEPDGDGDGNGGGDNGGGDNDGGGGGGCGCNDNPSEAPEICAAEGSDSVLVAHENCNQFYICSFGSPVAMSCPDNLLYNPATEQCDWPENVECGDRVIPEPDGDGDGNGGGDNNGGGGGGCGCNDNPSEAPEICAAEGSDSVLVAHENCNQFYICSFGSPVAMSCPDNLLYNPATEQCDWPVNVECGDRVIPEPDGDGDGNGGGDNNGGGGGGCGCNDNPSEAPEICAAEGSDSVLVAHENCNQFYICAFGSPVAMSCPDNLLYNPATEQCDWPENVECGDRVIPEPDGDGDGNGGGDNGGGDNDGGGGGGCGCNDNPSEAPEICAAEGSDSVLVAHENCNQFYICSFGSPVSMSCPDNLLYNPATEQCDWPENVECGDRVIPEPDGDGDGNGGGDNDGGGGGGCGCNDNPSEAPEICAAEGSDSVLVAHENCNQFYICSFGSPVAMSCPDNLLYNPATEQCDWPENVECGDRVIPEPDGDGDDNDGDDNNGGGGGGGCGCHDNPSEAPEICAAEGSNGVLVAHENCNQFYICSFGSPVAMSCPDNLLYNPATEQCDWPENVECGDRVIPEPDGDDNDGDDNNGGGGGGGCGCHDNPSEAPEICAAEGSNGVLVAHENCNQFYICSFGSPVAMSCPDNLLYNPATEQCDWPGNVECGDRVIPEPDGDDNDGDDNNGGGGGGGCGCHDNPSEAPEICAAEGSNGVLVAHENCNQFYICSFGSPVAMSCPDNLLYNPATEQCDWPGNVECGDRVIPEPDGDDNDGDDNNGGGGGGGCGCHDNPSEAPEICAAEGSNGVLVAHENCNQFYTCSFGSPVAMSCPDNLLYNPATEQCDWPENVECGTRVIPDGDEGNNENGDNNGNGDDDNGNTGNCDPSEAPAICAAEGSNGVLVAHELCNKFYMCSFGAPVAMSCSDNLLFNPALNYCDWPENVDCGDRNIPDPEDENTDTDDNDDEYGDTEDNENDNDNDNDIDDHIPIDVEAACAASGADGVYLPHPICCNQFYICVGGEASLMDCPSITLYNPVTYQCDWPQYVDCGDRIRMSSSKSQVSLNKHLEMRRLLRI